MSDRLHEIIGEIGVVYLIYFTLKIYINALIDRLLNNIQYRIPYFEEILLIVFSLGIYKHLNKSSFKLKFLRDKYLKFGS